jgi:hypothetical protein
VATPRPLPDALAGRSYSLLTPGTLFSDLALRWPLNLKWYGLSVQNGSKRFYFLWLHLATPGFTGGSVRGLALLTPGWGTVCDFSGRSSAGALTNCDLRAGRLPAFNERLATFEPVFHQLLDERIDTFRASVLPALRRTVFDCGRSSTGFRTNCDWRAGLLPALERIAT